ncbi:MAG: phosphate/phosphite/phosphonate ABC transporter substrate-binding protein [Syntrophales bacterium]|nr:phosphate/phosphite/phosphonate ABC transporter substrate-binding protein [Syntrophales bacterium]MDD5641537.1 phosphate/phosphite/phosphonate ABC transporter substrate-binding protein [Syntrophales bacterium]
MARWCFFVCMAVTCLLIAGCGDDEPVKKIDLSNREEITVIKPPAALTYAYLPQYSHNVSYKRHHLLVEYLSRATGLTIRQVFPDTFDEHINMVGRGEIDISFSNPYAYVQIARRYGARAFARIVEGKGEINFRGQVICRADNHRIKTPADLKGKRLIAVDAYSAGGYLYPWDWILEQGLRKKDFLEIAFAPGPGGKQEKVVMGVYSGKYDVGLIRERTLPILANKIDLKQIRILAHSRWYPGWVYAARRGLDPDILAKIKKALLALDMKIPEQRKILEKAGFTGVVPASDADYEAVRRLAASVESRD